MDSTKRHPDDEDLYRRLEEAEETLRAIRAGEVDSLVVEGPDGPRVYALEGVNHSYRILVEAMSEGAVSLGEDGTVLYCNSRFAAMVEAPLERVMGSPVQEFIRDSQQARFRAMLQQAHQGEGRDEFVLRTGGGTEFPAQLSISASQDGGRRALCLVATDLRERKKSDALVAAERAARESESRIRAVFESATDAILVADPRGPGTLLAVNPAACRLFGYTEAELVGLDWPAIVDVSSGSTQAFLGAREREGHAAAVLTYVRKDGSRFAGEVTTASYVLQDGEVRAVAVVRDVTERRRAEEALRVSEAFLRTLVENVAVGVALIDEAGRFTQYNRRFLDLFGLAPESTPASVNHEDWGRWQVLDAQEQLLRLDDHPVRKAALSGQPVRDQLVGVRRPSGGDPIWMLVSAVGITMPVGVQFICTYQDVTAMRLAEQAVREADRRKTEFLAVLSHELRNPLAPIRNSLYLLDRAPPGSPHAVRAKDVVQRQTAHLTRLVDDLLDVTRVSRGKIDLKPERIDIREVVRRVCEDHRTFFESSEVDLRLDLPAWPVWIDADVTRIAQVIGNLLQNAAKFTPARGQVTVGVENGTKALVRVRDNGVGIEQDLLGRLFEPFVQADRGLARTAGGLGLGLALARSLVELHGGTVSARSEGGGRGAEFLIRAPARVGPGADEAGRGPPRRRGRARRAHHRGQRRRRAEPRRCAGARRTSGSRGTRWQVRHCPCARAEARRDPVRHRPA